jgi:hypothetical protein
VQSWSFRDWSYRECLSCNSVLSVTTV